MIPRAAREPESAPPFTFAFAALLTLLSAMIYIIVLSASVGALGTASFMLAHGIALLVAFGNAFLIASRRITLPLRSALALSSAAPLAWMTPFLLLPALLLVSELDNVAAALLPAPEGPRMELPPASGLGLLVSGFVLLVLEPLARETFFRGLVQGRLAALWGGLRAVIATSLLSWAFDVLRPEVEPVVLFKFTIHSLSTSVLLSIVRQSSGSLLPALLLSTLFGAVQLLAEQKWLSIPGFDDMSAAHTPAVWLLPASLLTAAGLQLCYRLSRPQEQ